MASSPPRALGRLVLKRIAATGTRRLAVSEPWPADQLPWSRTLWGEFLPERRSRSLVPPRGLDRRRG